MRRQFIEGHPSVDIHTLEGGEHTYIHGRGPDTCMAEIH